MAVDWEKRASGRKETGWAGRGCVPPPRAVCVVVGSWGSVFVTLIWSWRLFIIRHHCHHCPLHQNCHRHCRRLHPLHRRCHRPQCLSSQKAHPQSSLPAPPAVGRYVIIWNLHPHAGFIQSDVRVSALRISPARRFLRLCSVNRRPLTLIRDMCTWDLPGPGIEPMSCRQAISVPLRHLESPLNRNA